MFGEILHRFSEKSPSTVMVRALLEQLLNPEKLDRWFEVTRQAQYTRDILFSSLVGLMLQVVCKTRASVHAAYRHANIAASIVAVYAKLKGVEWPIAIFASCNFCSIPTGSRRFLSSASMAS